mmetsp:Transcript_51121/g.84750  ORF Transcript_51121/g.84750 Transcript_51121/m.84750 type:complete len:89 (+) Transcript_51121:703-969(+)
MFIAAETAALKHVRAVGSASAPCRPLRTVAVSIVARHALTDGAACWAAHEHVTRVESALPSLSPASASFVAVDAVARYFVSLLNPLVR